MANLKLKKMKSFLSRTGMEELRLVAASRRNDSLIRQAGWFIQLRWQAVAVSTVLILAASLVTRSISATLLPYLLTCVLSLVVANGLFLLLQSRRFDPHWHIVLQVSVDLCILTAMLHFSGGLENPLFALYALHVIIAGILLPRATTFALTGFACALLALLGIAELEHWVPHYTLRLFPHPSHLGTLVHASHHPGFVASQIVSFSVVLFLTAYFATLVSRRLRRSERELEQVAEEAETERRRLKSVVDAVGAGLILVSKDLRVLWFSQRVREWFGLSDVHLGTPCNGEGWCASDAGKAICRAAECASATEIMHEEFSTEVKAEKRYFSVTTAPIFSAEGPVDQYAELVQDITGRKITESQMLHAAKMAALGTLAAGVAHEIGNPLSSLSTRLQLLESRKEPDFVSESVRLLKDQIGRIERIVRGVAHFGRPVSQEWQPCDLNRILDESVGLLKLDRRAKSIDIQVKILPRELVIMGVKDQLLQVFLNLGLNAIEAMPKGGTLVIRSSSDGTQARISVEDNGCGLSKEARDRLFSPFYTTKKEGTGLGLSICASIVNAHGGQIQADSVVGKGTTFTVVLPRMHAAPKPRSK